MKSKSIAGLDFVSNKVSMFFTVMFIPYLIIWFNIAKACPARGLLVPYMSSRIIFAISTFIYIMFLINRNVLYKVSKICRRGSKVFRIVEHTVGILSLLFVCWFEVNHGAMIDVSYVTVAQESESDISDFNSYAWSTPGKLLVIQYAQIEDGFYYVNYKLNEAVALRQGKEVPAEVVAKISSVDFYDSLYTNTKVDDTYSYIKGTADKITKDYTSRVATKTDYSDVLDIVVERLEKSTVQVLRIITVYLIAILYLICLLLDMLLSHLLLKHNFKRLRSEVKYLSNARAQMLAETIRVQHDDYYDE